MDIKFFKRSFLQRMFRVSETKKPTAVNYWDYEEGKLVINLHETSEPRNPGGAIRLEGKNLPIRVLVVRGENGEYIDINTAA